MGSPRPILAGTAAEDSDWEPSDGEEGDAPPPPRVRALVPLRPAAIQAARRRRLVRSGRRGRAVRGRRQMEMLGRAAVSSRGRGVAARARPTAAQTAQAPPADHERASSETRDGIQANNRTRQPSKFIPRSSPLSPESVCGIFLRQISLDAMVRVRATTEIYR
jgi:hypothetical protein